MIMSNPFLYETHMQIMSDVLISNEGKLGTMRPNYAKQFPSLYFSHTDLKIPFSDSENFPHLNSRLSLGAFTRSFENIFHR